MTQTNMDNSSGVLPNEPKMTEADLLEAQELWGNAVIAIGEADGRHSDVAEEAAKALYAFELGPILFKPTLASVQPFRPDLEGALSYFVGGNAKYPEDKGFGLKSWKHVRFENHTIQLFGNRAIAMGHYYFTDPSGDVTKVEYTKGYVKTEDSRVLIFLQHSSLPYTA